MQSGVMMFWSALEGGLVGISAARKLSVISGSKQIGTSSARISIQPIGRLSAKFASQITSVRFFI